MSCVYLVDDDASVLKATSRVLRAAGFEVRAFANPAAYLEQFDAEAGGCLVLDFQMPTMNGIQLRQELVGRGGDALPVIFLSGSAGVAGTAEAMRGAAARFLLKPVDADDLIGAVREALSRERTPTPAGLG